MINRVVPDTTAVAEWETTTTTEVWVAAATTTGCNKSTATSLIPIEIDARCPTVHSATDTGRLFLHVIGFPVLTGLDAATQSARRTEKLQERPLANNSMFKPRCGRHLNFPSNSPDCVRVRCALRTA